MLIRTKYLGPTNHRGARIAGETARSSETRSRAVVSYDGNLRVVEAHREAAEACLDRYIETHKRMMGFDRKKGELICVGEDDTYLYWVESERFEARRRNQREDRA